ncbi:putative ribonuclease H protein At1g65750 family [Senna tora]|uniref:Putative ribonuclease H protein At1g65750 family n=1 Tax=Senna tora TaxID=362788 RepID=A0A834TUL7_9FABA|nr:putative ribonuclease H protein At1g65750 family [Senna tora]
MTKLGWGLVANKDSLWARVLRAKYYCGDDIIPTMRTSSNSSQLWKAMVRNWHHTSEGLEWRLGDGKRIRFWLDAWVPGCGKLCDIALAPITQDEVGACVAEYITSLGGWNWSKFEFLIPNPINLKIAALHPPSSAESQDRVAWRYINDGRFTVQSAYQRIAGVNENEQGSLWRSIWRMQVPQRVRSCIWLCTQNKLLTNAERVKRCMTHYAECTRCGSSFEDVLHAIRDCTKVKSLWLRLVKPSKWPLFFSLDLDRWIQLNLSMKIGVLDFDWTIIFAMTCWSVWRWRNEEIIGDGSSGEADPFFTIIRRVRNVREAFDMVAGGQAKSAARVNRIVIWERPELGWLKINVDGASSRDNFEMAACGGVVRNECGDFVLGETFGVGKVVIEMDSLVACEMIKAPIVDTHPCSALIRGIHSRCNGVREVVFRHVYREANRAADAMPSYAYRMNRGLMFHSSPPAEVVSVLNDDMLGVRTTRACVAVS